MKTLLVALLIFCTASLNAQAGDTVEISLGSRVRLSGPAVPFGRMAGTVVGQRGDTLLLSRDGEVPSAIPFSEVEGVEVRRGWDRARYARRGALGAAPLLVGLYLAESADSRGGIQAERVLSVAGMGAVGGGIAGWILAPERWEPLPAPPPSPPRDP